MATINLHVSEELLAELREKAAVEGKTVEELAEQVLRKGLEERDLQDLLAYGRENGRQSVYKESDVPDLVRKWRHEQRNR